MEIYSILDNDFFSISFYKIPRKNENRGVQRQTRRCNIINDDDDGGGGGGGGGFANRNKNNINNDEDGTIQAAIEVK